LKKVLGKNYEDYERFRGLLNKKEEESKGDAHNEDFKYFVALQEADISKPIWTSYADNPQNIDTLVHYLPLSMQKLIRRTLPNLEN
jgi:hypothetical protein